MSSSSRRIIGSLKKDSAKSSTWSQTCERMKPYVCNMSCCTLSTTTSIWCSSVGMSCSHLESIISMFERFWISLGTRAFTSSKEDDGRTGLEPSSPSPPSPPSPPLRKTHGFENSDVSMLSKSSQNCWSCRWQARSYMSKMRCLIISFCLMSFTRFGKSLEYMFADGVPSSFSMNSSTASFWIMKNHLMRSPTYWTRRCNGTCASWPSSLTTTSRQVTEPIDTPRAWITSRLLMFSEMSEKRKNISTSEIMRLYMAPPFTSTSKAPT
mmetsp:Transcript_40025/g.111208  ORF Transcript_40025/g.111208 Transcript_40025/m.111208 type:complete len:267 (+) Transcript_40025:182-982(+)